MPSDDTASSIASRTRSILAVCGLSLSDVARASRTLFRGDPRFHVPPNLYHSLDRGFSPSIHQLFALSRLSDFRLIDWLAVFGVILDDIPRLQATLPSRYTTFIDENVYDDHSWLLSFQAVAPGFVPGSIRPLQEWLRIAHPRRHEEVKNRADPEFVYAKIGCYDAFAYPELLPGSIVRVAKHQLPDTRKSATGSLFLVEHARGLVCSKLYVAERNRVVLCPSLLPFAQVELELGRDVRVVGTVDFELRLTAGPVCPRVPLPLARFWIPAPFEKLSDKLYLDRLLRRARQRSGLTFREASAKSALIARALGNKEFFCSPGSLSDYETATQAASPHSQDVFSVRLVFARRMGIHECNGTALVRSRQSGHAGRIDGTSHAFHLESASDQDTAPSIQSETAVAKFPYFFGAAAAELLNLPHLSIRDIFWVEGPRESFHPYLRDAAALIVDRRKKRITTYRACPLWAQPSYILLGHEGTYLCASCGSDGRTLVMRPFSNGFKRPVRLRRPEEVEVIGRVVGILRRFSAENLSAASPLTQRSLKI